MSPATSLIVWYAMPRPSSIARFGEAVPSSSPAISTVPSSAWLVPLAMPSRVDLPEPFSPSRAWISPERNSMVMSWFAFTGP